MRNKSRVTHWKVLVCQLSQRNGSRHFAMPRLPREMTIILRGSLNFIPLLRVVITPSVTSDLNRPAVNAVQWRHYSLIFALIHAKSKTRFSSGKSRNIVWKCLDETELLDFFDRNSCLTFKLSTACSTTLNRLYCNSIIKLGRNHAMK